ncbi:MAG: prepilin-type N-terminal cleavage/methylation domain-containing protein [Pseudomonadota bacterium]
MKVAPSTILSKRGFSLLEAMVTIGILSTAGMILMNMNMTAMKASKSSSMRSELQDIKQTLNSRLSCLMTLDSFGPSRPVKCSGPVTLRDKNSTILVPPNGKLGGWTISARCEKINGNNGLSIYATRKKADGQFAKDPLNPNIILDETNPLSLLYKADVRPCSDFFVPDAALESLAKTCSESQRQGAHSPNGEGACQNMPALFNVPLKDLNAALTSGSGDSKSEDSCDPGNIAESFLFCMSGCARWCQISRSSKSNFTSGVFLDLNISQSTANCGCF